MHVCYQKRVILGPKRAQKGPIFGVQKRVFFSFFKMNLMPNPHVLWSKNWGQFLDRFVKKPVFFVFLTLFFSFLIFVHAVCTRLCEITCSTTNQSFSPFLQICMLNIFNFCSIFGQFWDFTVFEQKWVHFWTHFWKFLEISSVICIWKNSLLYHTFWAIFGSGFGSVLEPKTTLITSNHVFQKG